MTIKSIKRGSFLYSVKGKILFAIEYAILGSLIFSAISHVFFNLILSYIFPELGRGSDLITSIKIGAVGGLIMASYAIMFKESYPCFVWRFFKIDPNSAKKYLLSEERDLKKIIAEMSAQLDETELNDKFYEDEARTNYISRLGDYEKQLADIRTQLNELSFG